MGCVGEGKLCDRHPDCPNGLDEICEADSNGFTVGSLPCGEGYQLLLSGNPVVCSKTNTRATSITTTITETTSSEGTQTDLKDTSSGLDSTGSGLCNEMRGAVATGHAFLCVKTLLIVLS